MNVGIGARKRMNFDGPVDAWLRFVRKAQPVQINSIELVTGEIVPTEVERDGIVYALNLDSLVEYEEARAVEAWGARWSDGGEREGGWV